MTKTGKWICVGINKLILLKLVGCAVTHRPPSKPKTSL